MKKHIVILFLLALGFQVALAQKDKFTVQVDGMGCPFCAYGLEKKFKEVEGISKMQIEIETGILRFEVPSNKGMTIAQAEERVNASGYTPRSVAVTRADGREEKSEAAPAVPAEGVERRSFMVAGSCDMCKARIEKAALDVKGVQQAEWNAEQQMLTVSYDAALVQLPQVQAAVSHSGHDNVGGRANAKTYSKLPACCQYR